MKNFEIEILYSNYWEHFKHEKELSMYLAVDHPRRILVHEESQKILEKVRKLKEENDKL